MPLALIDGDLDIGNIWVDSSGYARHSIGNQGDRYVHRTISELVLGRKLCGREQVHHVNGNKLDNRRVNLVICPDDAYHKILHARTDMLLDGFSPETHNYCTGCKEYHLKDAFPKNSNAWNGVHNMCKETTNNARRGKGYGKFTWIECMQQQFRRAIKKGTVSSLFKEGRCL